MDLSTYVTIGMGLAHATLLAGIFYRLGAIGEKYNSLSVRLSRLE